MISIRRALRHLAWADSRFFDAVALLPDAALGSRYAPDAWTVAELLVHIVDGAEWYRYCLTGQAWSGLVAPVTMADVASLRDQLVLVDATFLDEADLADEPLNFADEHGDRTALRSTLLAQAVHHACEHRAQVACALTAAGFAAPVLDDLDLWAFEAGERASE